jgi:threonine synthase
MIGIQAEGAAPIAKAYRERKIEIKPVECPETIATAIRIGAPVNWKKALRAVYDSGGLLETVGDQEILQAHMEMAQLEGLFVEPASAAPVAGLKKLIECREIDRGEVTVCVATGHGLKDPEVVLKHYASSAGLEVELDSLSIMLTNLARGG